MNNLATTKNCPEGINGKLNLLSDYGSTQCDLTISESRTKVIYSKTCVKRSLKNRQNKDLNGQW